MKIKCAKDSLLKGLSLINNIVNDKQTIPVLANVLIDATERQTKLAATDLKISMECEFNAEIVEPGAITVSAKKLMNIIRELPNQLITLSVDENFVVQISCGKSHFKIMGISKDEFPNIPDIEEQEIVLTQKELKTFLKRTSFSMSNESGRYVLNGLFMKVKDKEMILVSTDCRRLSFVSKTLEEKVKGEYNMIIPAKMVMELQRVLADQDQEAKVVIVLGEKEISFKMEGVRYIAQLIEGHYPSYEEVIPPDANCILELNKEEFYGILRRAAVLIHQNVTRIRLNIKENKIYFSSKVPSLGEFKEDIDVQYEGEEIIIGFNPIFLMDVLKNTDEEKITFSISGSNSEGLARRAGMITTGDDFVHVIMPMDLS